MKEYEIVLTYLNGCAGAAYPQISFDKSTKSYYNKYEIVQRRKP